MFSDFCVFKQSAHQWFKKHTKTSHYIKVFHSSCPAPYTSMPLTIPEWAGPSFCWWYDSWPNCPPWRSKVCPKNHLNRKITTIYQQFQPKLFAFCFLLHIPLILALKSTLHFSDPYKSPTISCLMICSESHWSTRSNILRLVFTRIWCPPLAKRLMWPHEKVHLLEWICNIDTSIFIFTPLK